MGRGDSFGVTTDELVASMGAKVYDAKLYAVGAGFSAGNSMGVIVLATTW